MRDPLAYVAKGDPFYLFALRLACGGEANGDKEE